MKSISMRKLVQKLNSLYDTEEYPFTVTIHKGFLFWYAVVDTLVEMEDTNKSEYEIGFTPYYEALMT